MFACVQAWIRRRAKQGGMPRPEAVALVSALKGTGVDDLLIRLHKEVGTNGDVWVVRPVCFLPICLQLLLDCPLPRKCSALVALSGKRPSTVLPSRNGMFDP